jgi:(p)ppGpp synthase/HD superfamily hydrolase
MRDLEDAIELAVKAHRGQKDKYGRPYILHPLSLMLKMESDEQMTAAVLHDVVEDTSVTLEDLKREGFGPRILEAVDSLSRREGESYEDYIERLSGNPAAVKVKLADLEHNMLLTRMPDISEADIPRLARYLRAWKKLKHVRPPGAAAV